MPPVALKRTMVFNSEVAKMFECNACRALVAQSVFGWMCWLQTLFPRFQGTSCDLKAHAAGIFDE